MFATDTQAEKTPIFHGKLPKFGLKMVKTLQEQQSSIETPLLELAFPQNIDFALILGSQMGGVSEFGLKTHVSSLWPLLSFYGASNQHFSQSWLHFGFLWVAPWLLLVHVASISIPWQPSGAFSSYNFALILQSQMGILNFF